MDNNLGFIQSSYIFNLFVRHFRFIKEVVVKIDDFQIYSNGFSEMDYSIFLNFSTFEVLSDELIRVTFVYPWFPSGC
jgi:hypothetical protein